MDNKLFDKYGLVADEGKVIFHENEIGDKMYIIQEGSVRITKQIGGKDHTLAVLNKGDFFGEMAIVSQIKRTATVTAVGTVRLLSFDREGFIGMIEKNARIALNIIDKLCRRLQQANTQIQHLVRNNERGLVALNLYYAFSERGFEQAVLDFHKTVRDLSLNMEIPQEQIYQIIQDLHKQGVIRVDGRDLLLVDRNALNQIGDSLNR